MLGEANAEGVAGRWCDNNAVPQYSNTLVGTEYSHGSLLVGVVEYALLTEGGKSYARPNSMTDKPRLTLLGRVKTQLHCTGMRGRDLGRNSSSSKYELNKGDIADGGGLAGVLGISAKRGMELSTGLMIVLKFRV